MAPPGVDDDIRTAVFTWLDDQVQLYGDRIPWSVLQSFEHVGRRTALITQRGIRWQSGHPALTFNTTFSADPSRAPYADRIGQDGLPRYKYQGNDPTRPDNVAMLRSEQLGLPMVWFIGTDEGVYSAQYPVYVIGHDDESLDFTVAIDAEQRALVADDRIDFEAKRRYAERLTRQRLHQPIFRSQVLRAYELRCTICHLGHLQLLDAAHIRSDALGGEPVVPNGLAMCKLHHAAYDENLLSVNADYRVIVAPAVRAEKDGPMLLHGLQEMHDTAITLPRRVREHPNRDLLAQRHLTFLERASA